MSQRSNKGLTRIAKIFEVHLVRYVSPVGVDKRKRYEAFGCKIWIEISGNIKVSGNSLVSRRAGCSKVILGEVEADLLLKQR